MAGPHLLYLGVHLHMRSSATAASIAETGLGERKPHKFRIRRDVLCKPGGGKTSDMISSNLKCIFFYDQRKTAFHQIVQGALVQISTDRGSTTTYFTQHSFFSKSIFQCKPFICLLSGNLKSLHFFRLKRKIDLFNFLRQICFPGFSL